MPSNAIRVLLCDDRSDLRALVRDLLKTETDLEVVAEADDWETFLPALSKSNPDVIVLDGSLSGRSGFDVIEETRATASDARIVMFTMESHRAYVDRALALGANGYVLKDSAITELAAGIREAYLGRIYVDSRLRALDLAQT